MCIRDRLCVCVSNPEGKSRKASRVKDYRLDGSIESLLLLVSQVTGAVLWRLPDSCDMVDRQICLGMLDVCRAVQFTIH